MAAGFGGQPRIGVVSDDEQQKLPHPVAHVRHTRTPRWRVWKGLAWYSASQRLTAEPGGRITVRAVAGRTYQLECSDELGAVDWAPVGQPQMASAASLNFHDPLGAGPARFDRVVRPP